ncbi:dual specificity protein phosphatase family protein [Planococcus sp. APC 3906]|uniref:protein-tyrosine phosphatase family protein n=1 Tax=Planococcus sp. APC 3906 TaxID=3035194 RepID=UPI0025B6162E|nr:dual specificity protein phosphatase family protein [Planococcus sp. APC 3906]MDN3449402.1 dual specificity protein phosphatase family protein [Planococcus sp. APC 3906]
MEKAYQELVKDKIYVGGAADAQAAADNEKVDVVIDLRAEATQEDTDYNRIVCPIIEDSEEHQDESIKKAIDQVKKAYDSGQKVFFHCGGGSNRAGTVAVGTLLALGKADTIEQAEKDATAIRSKINVRPEFKESLKRIFPEA